MVTGIEHFGLVARDTAALKDWYCRIFGTTLAYDNGKTPPTYFVRFADGALLEIYPMSDDSPVETAGNKTRGLRHIALSVDDFDATANALLAEGVEVLDAPATSASGVSTFFFRDPEGNILHLIHRVQPL